MITDLRYSQLHHRFSLRERQGTATVRSDQVATATVQLSMTETVQPRARKCPEQGYNEFVKMGLDGSLGN